MLLWIGLMSTAFGVSVLSALIPLISVELFVIALMLRAPDTAWWQLAAVVAAGQVVGKLLYYYAGRGSLPLPKVFRRTEDTPSRWSLRLARFREACRGRPVWTAGVLLSSSFVSLPPFAAVSVIAGVAGIPLRTFVLTGLAGRFGRFALVAVVPGIAGAWWF
ncbi:putative membrane protein [Actinoalloteichus sp. GBA129-24]|uniref:Membrane protein n=2 Tax=Pseudonocardiaceae TaxID=2070 RepID=A0AAC9LA97_9PSEU|nr:putative membrane protein [Actinoalloteichus fjordicus]APU19893.1 putative membrane protein [Actinoalloteichus sp. GBA129-24]